MRAWEEFIESLESELGSPTVAKWLRPLKVTRFDAANLYLEAQDSFQISWFEEQLRKKAEGELLNPNGRPIKVHLSLPSDEEKKPRTKASKENEFELTFDGLDGSFTFANFHGSPGNQLAHELLRTLCTGDRVDLTLGTYNPIYLHGAEGTGKTHLLMATAKALSDKGIHALYARAETFTDHVVRAIRAGEMQLFRKAYRNIDVLLIDNIQLLARKGATQEELFHTFNTLHLAGRQLILAADCAPGELKSVEPRLVSRFEWGLAVQLHPPSEKEMRLILADRAQMLGLKLSKEIADFLIATFSRSLKVTVRALEALILRAHLEKGATQLNLATARRFLSDLINEEADSLLTTDRIVEKVAGHFGIQTGDILGKSQRKECALPRKVAMYLIRSKLSLSFPEIGRFFARDHSTVITSVRNIEEQMQLSEELGVTVQSIGKGL
jgi:chromosomal replication initiator protein